MASGASSVCHFSLKSINSWTYVAVEKLAFFVSMKYVFQRCSCRSNLIGLNVESHLVAPHTGFLSNVSEKNKKVQI